MPIPTAPHRAPLMIRDGVIDIGVNRTRFNSEHDDGLLRSYLLILRRARDQRRAASITLRRDDIEVIAKYVDASPEEVLGRLADLMGSTRTQRAAMLTVFATGAMLIAATGSVAAGSPPSAVPEFVKGHAPSAIEVIAPLEVHNPSSTTPPMLAVESDRQPDLDGGNVEAEVLVDVEIYDAEVTVSSEGQPDETGVTNDGSTVAVGLPPVPRPAESLPNQTEATAPVSAPVSPVIERQTLSSESLSTETGVTDDGSTVAVGLPPVPVPPSSG